METHWNDTEVDTMPHRWPADTDYIVWELDVLDRDSASCGRMMHICDHRYRRFFTLEGMRLLSRQSNPIPRQDRDSGTKTSGQPHGYESKVAPGQSRSGASRRDAHRDSSRREAAVDAGGVDGENAGEIEGVVVRGRDHAAGYRGVDCAVVEDEDVDVRVDGRIVDRVRHDLAVHVRADRVVLDGLAGAGGQAAGRVVVAEAGGGRTRDRGPGR